VTGHPQQLAEEAVQRFLAGDAVARDLGVTVSRAAPGEVIAQLTVTGDQVNGHGSAHGSILFAVADIAFAMACNSHGHLAIGRSCAIEYLAPAFPGDTITAHAVERTREGRTGIYDVAVRREAHGALLAEMRAVSRELRGAPGAAVPDPDGPGSSRAPR
jgi:acyl-CoA thioesterase